MANSPEQEELQDAPATFRSHVWKYFGFPVTYNDSGVREVDKSVTVCKLCGTRKSYDDGNTSSMGTHLTRHHPDKVSTGAKPPTNPTQPSLPSAFSKPLSRDSPRAKSLTKAVGQFIAGGMHPYSVVEDYWFKNLMKVAEPRYTLPSRPHFRDKVVANLYSVEKERIVDGLAKASHIALTTDGWTSRSTKCFMTVTAHYITEDWTMGSVVLQTRVI